MVKKYSAFILLASLFPQTALAHFENPHGSFWAVPMHWLIEHYIGLALIGVALISVVIVLKRRSEKE